MKRFLICALMFILWNYDLTAQTITGKVIDETGAGLQSYTVNLFISPNIFTASTDSAGYFTINLTEVKEETLPKDYTISNNYPNPFNPRTRIDFSLPQSSKIKVEIFNSIGQNVGNTIEKEMQAGNNYIDLELNGLPNGVYFARINVNDKYNVVRKMMLLYGSQHLSSSIQNNEQYLSKSVNLTSIDSIVVNVGLVRSKTFSNLPELTGNQLDVGNLQIQISCPDIQTVLYEGKTYHTVQIGSQCWLKENLNVGTMVLNTVYQNDNGVIEKHCYDNLEANCVAYGGLYNIGEALNYMWEIDGRTGLCPEGWRVPNLLDINKLKSSVQNNSRSLLSKGEGVGTNISGFSALFAGYVQGATFLSQHSVTGFWSWAGETLLLEKPYPWMTIPDLDYNEFSIRCLLGVRPEGELTFLSPAQNATYVSLNPKIMWKKHPNSDSYWIQIATDYDFNNKIIDKRGVVDTFITIGPLVNSKTYYMRIRAENEVGLTQNWTQHNGFTTISLIPTGVPCPGAETVVYEGKIYHTVKIVNTCWFKENLDVGEMIPSTQNQTNNMIIEKYCYNNMPANCAEYGGLYQWKEAMQYSSPTLQGVKGICPDGWKLATRTNIDEIVNYANNNFSSILAAGSNETGFSAKLGGYSYSVFFGMGSSTRIWSDFGFSPDGSLVVFFLKIDNTASNSYNDGWGANSVRCTKPAP